jgi:glycosyltransferase involved in cell wall biosynthesis
MARICLITPGQPATNPRLVKEADALSAAGHDVRALYSYTTPWGDEVDRAWRSTRPWEYVLVGGSPNNAWFKYYWTRVRCGVARYNRWAWPYSRTVRNWAAARSTHELMNAAAAAKADLYIAHYAGALVAAAHAARKHRTMFAFDAEDFESGSYLKDKGPGPHDQLVAKIEREYLPQCSYVTAASPLIAEAYRDRYSIPLPETILNVFPLAQRPPAFSEREDNGPVRLYWFSQTIGMDRGLDDVVHALGYLSDLSFELHLRGRFSSAADRTALLELADHAGVSRNQIIMHSLAPPAEMVRLSSAYDIGLALERPSTENHDRCLSNKVLTYILAGNAIVATATRAQRGLFNAFGECAVVYEPGDIATLAAALRIWHDDRACLRRARRTAWDWGTRRFNWEMEKQRLVDVVERALSVRGLVAASTA